MIDINLIKVSPNLNVKLGNQKRVGILNKGRNNKYISNSFESLDVGIDDQGKNTLAEDNKFK